MDRRLRSVVRSILPLIAISLFALDANADVPMTVSVAPPQCPVVVEDGALLRLLRIELGTDGVREVVPATTADTLGRIRVEATCAPNTTDVDVTIEDIATKKTARQTLSIAGIALDARPRVLSVAIAELLRTRWAELASSDASSPPKAVPTETTPRPEIDHETSRSVPPLGTTLSLGLDAQLFAAYGSALVGPSIGVSIPLPLPLIRVRLDAQADFGRATDALGTMNLALYSGSVGVMLAGRGRELVAELGPMLTVGYGTVTGYPTAEATGSSGGGAVISTGGSGRLGLLLGGSFWTVLGLEGGFVLQSLEVTAAARTTAGFGGPFLGAKLGVAYAF